MDKPVRSGGTWLSRQRETERDRETAAVEYFFSADDSEELVFTEQVRPAELAAQLRSVTGPTGAIIE